MAGKKNFKNQTPIDNLAGVTPVEPITNEVPAVEVEKISKIENEPEEKNKSGRKPLDKERGCKKNYTKNVNVAIPLEVLEKMEIAKAKYKNNLTLYINTLIEKDLDANYDSYVTLYRMLNE